MSDTYPTVTDFAYGIAQRQYFHKDEYGNPIEDFEGMLQRTARHVARAEAVELYKEKNGEYPSWYVVAKNSQSRNNMLKAPEKFDAWFESNFPEAMGVVDKWESKFYDLMRSLKFLPGGRTLTGAASSHGQLANCFVTKSDGRYISTAKNDPDSVDGIQELNYKLAKITKVGGGNGLCLSVFRERNAPVRGSGGVSSGAVSWLRHTFNPTLRVTKQEGVRRGAGMATIHDWHPDLLDFFTCKDPDREAVEGQIECFNISVLVSDKFIRAVEEDAVWTFHSPTNNEVVKPTAVAGKFHYPGEMPTSVTGNPNDPATSVEIPWSGSGIPAKWLWDQLARHAWKTGDPGVIFIDRINEFWPFVEELGPIDATNPCGEIPLFAGEQCVLGSMVLSRYVDPEALTFMESEFKKDVRTAVRFLDNVTTMTAHPLAENREMGDNLRRIGLGVMGLADMLLVMRTGYSSQDGLAVQKQVAKALRQAANKESEKLADARGAYPMWEEVSPTRQDLPRRRNVHILAIAPTGTISMVADTSSGIEPIFALAMQRKVGTEYQFKLHPVFENYISSPEFRKNVADINDEAEFVAMQVPEGQDAAGNTIYGTSMVHPMLRDIVENHGSVMGLDDWFDKEEQQFFSTAHDVSGSEHVAIQALWQSTLDGSDGLAPMSSISKTCNLPNKATVGDVQRVYQEAFEGRCKGVTIYRDGSRANQVLRTVDAEANTPSSELQEAQAEIEILNARLENAVRGLQPVHRGRDTTGSMRKFTFKDANGRSRKVYIFVGCNQDGPVETFVTDEKGGGEVKVYAAAMGRLVSTMLKYGIPPMAVSRTLIGLQGDAVAFNGGIYQSVPDALGKMLDEAATASYSEHRTDKDAASYLSGSSDCGDPEVCPNVVADSGCRMCHTCGWSKCS